MGTAEEHGYMDVFTEADFSVTGNDPTPLALNNSVGIYLGNLPKVDLSNGRFFYGYRIKATDLDGFKKLCKENNVQIVGKFPVGMALADTALAVMVAELVRQFFLLRSAL